MTIERFVLTAPMFVQGVRVLDFKRIVKLSDEDFAKLYLELMQEYRRDGWWTGGKIPKCNECHQPIPRPEQLRRYNGLSMHPFCFKQFYARECDDTGIMKKYWERVANLNYPD